MQYFYTLSFDKHIKINEYAEYIKQFFYGYVIMTTHLE